MRFTVAIDGPAGAGKGTLARALAERFGFAHLDTGLLYRAVGKRALDQGRGVIDDGVAALVARELRPQDLAADGLRTSLVARAASKVAAIPDVRVALLAFQRDFARREGGAVLDGRDIGTEVCPGADVKLFVTASLAERARRRHEELRAIGSEISLSQVLHDLEARDARDTGRKDAPLCQAEDAHLLDTTDLTIDAAIETAAGIIERSLPRAGT
ncbi:MAG: (d)CMP kinase [Paracoccaceae bacterium]